MTSVLDTLPDYGTSTPAEENSVDRDALLHALRIAQVVNGHRIAFSTGAGVSTDSGIPDYRSPGSPARQPMTIHDFLSTPDRRSRYWAGSTLGWTHMRSMRPNVSHEVMARLEHSHKASGVITQNVDGLHRRAGSRRVAELHGNLVQVECLGPVRHVFDRAAFTEGLHRSNPWLADMDLTPAPDGDALVDNYGDFIVPDCPICGAVLKPRVVFFGETVRPEVFDDARAIVADAEALVVVGTSLTVNTGLRVVEYARSLGQPIVILNRGPVRHAQRADLVIDHAAGPVLRELEHLI